MSQARVVLKILFWLAVCEYTVQLLLFPSAQIPTYCVIVSLQSQAYLVGGCTTTADAEAPFAQRPS